MNQEERILVTILKFKTTMLRCDYDDPYILVKKTIKITGAGNDVHKSD